MSAFDNLQVETGTLGSKSAVVTEIPEGIVKLIDSSWNVVKERPGAFCKVNLSSKDDVAEFHLFAKAAAKAHKPVLDYRKLPKREGQPETQATFTLRLLTADTPRPGRPAANGNGTAKAS